MKTSTKTKSHLLSKIAKNSNDSALNKIVAIAPIIIILLYTIFLALPITRNAALWALEENRPVELLSFFFAILGGVYGLVFAWQLKHHKEGIIALSFYLVFALGLLFLGAEEVAWGQWFLGFETPSAIKDINTQSELTLHNLEVWNDHLEVFPLIFGISGLIGIAINNIYSFRKIGAPYVLFSWFAIIFVISAIDLFQDFIVIQEQFDYLINYLDEVVEMLVAIAGFLYVWLNRKKFSLQWKIRNNKEV